MGRLIVGRIGCQSTSGSFAKIANGLKIRWVIFLGLMRDGMPLWCWLAGLFFIVAVSSLSLLSQTNTTQADAVRWAGILFQFTGLGAVVLGLQETRALFDREPFWSGALRWLGRWGELVIPQKSRSGSIGTVEEADSAMVVGIGRVRNKAITLKGRVEQLEKEVDALHGTLSALKTKIIIENQEVHQELEKEAGARVAGDKQVSDQLEAATIGGIHLELGGLLYLAIGIFLSSVPLSDFGSFQNPDQKLEVPIHLNVPPQAIKQRYRRVWPREAQ